MRNVGGSFGRCTRISSKITLFLSKEWILPVEETTGGWMRLFSCGFCALRQPVQVTGRRRAFFYLWKGIKKMSLKYTCLGCGTPLGYDGLCWKCKSEQDRKAALDWTPDQIAEKQKT